MCIGENTRLLYDIIHDFHAQKRDRAILSIDFEDALKSLDWEYAKNVFETMEFGKEFTKLFEMMCTCNDSFFLESCSMATWATNYAS